MNSASAHIPHWPLPAVRDLTRDGRWSTYDVSVLKLPNVSFRGKYARMGNSLKLPSPTKLARLGHFPPASHAGGPPCRPGVLYIFLFSVCTYKKTSIGSLGSFCSYFVCRRDIELSSSILRVNRLWRIKETQIKLGNMAMFLQNYICVICYQNYFFKSFFNNIELKILFLSLNIFQYCRKVFKQNYVGFLAMNS
jgi:hypothetical protein